MSIRATRSSRFGPCQSVVAGADCSRGADSTRWPGDKAPPSHVGSSCGACLQTPDAKRSADVVLGSTWQGLSDRGCVPKRVSCYALEHWTERPTACLPTRSAARSGPNTATSAQAWALNATGSRRSAAGDHRRRSGPRPPKGSAQQRGEDGRTATGNGPAARRQGVAVLLTCIRVRTAAGERPVLPHSPGSRSGS
jgi:hypothetical protein